MGSDKMAHLDFIQTRPRGRSAPRACRSDHRRPAADEQLRDGGLDASVSRHSQPSLEPVKAVVNLVEPGNRHTGNVKNEDQEIDCCCWKAARFFKRSRIADDCFFELFHLSDLAQTAV